MRKRKRQFTWIPVLPTVVERSEGPNEAVTWFNQQTGIVLGEPGRAFLSAINILPDHLDTYDPAQPDQASLRDIVEGQDYVVERIVGKIWGSVGPASGAPSDNDWLNLIIGAGIGVMPYDDNDTLSLSDDEIDPLLQGNSGNPWQWRRTWTLWNMTTNAGISAGLGPTSIQNDGPEYGFVDIKSVRRIRREERLTLVVSVHLMEGLGVGAASNIFNWGYDFRVLGAMRKAHNKSDFK